VNNPHYYSASAVSLFVNKTCKMSLPESVLDLLEFQAPETSPVFYRNRPQMQGLGLDLDFHQLEKNPVPHSKPMLDESCDKSPRRFSYLLADRAAAQLENYRTRHSTRLS
jgi:hypothetical protein